MILYGVASSFQAPNSGMLREHKSKIESSRWCPASRAATRLGRWSTEGAGARARVAWHAGAILSNGRDAWQELLSVAKVRREGF